MRRTMLVTGFAVVALSVLCLALLGAGEQGAAAIQAVVPLELTPLWRRAIPLDPGRLTIILPRGEDVDGTYKEDLFDSGTWDPLSPREYTTIY